MQGLLHLQHTPAVRPAPIRGAGFPALLGQSGVRRVRILRTRRTRGHPCPRPASPAGNLMVLRCSANLMGPRCTNPPSMAGSCAVPTALLRVLASVHARSNANAAHRRPAMDGGFLEWGPSEPPSIAGPSGSRPRRGRGHGCPRGRRVRRMRTRRPPEGPRSAGNPARRMRDGRLVGVCLGVQGALHKQGPLLGPRQRTETLCSLPQEASARHLSRQKIESSGHRSGGPRPAPRIRNNSKIKSSGACSALQKRDRRRPVSAPPSPPPPP